MKWMKRLLAAVAVLLIGLILFALVGLWMLHRKPAWYERLAMRHAMSDQQREAASKRVLDAMLELRNAAGESHSREIRAQRAAEQGTSAPATQPAAAPITKTFTQDDLNAFLIEWAEPHKDEYDPWVQDPVIALS